MTNQIPIVLDIEGTIAPIAFVREVLFPYASEHVGDLFHDFENSTDLVQIREDVATHLFELASFMQVDAKDREAFIDGFRALVASDVKQTNLKALQGILWKDGYEKGELKAPLYEDVPAFMSSRSPLYIYSSGSIAAQKLFLRYTNVGDVTGSIDGYFDTTSGPKKEVDSYRTISAAIGVESPWFGSDNPKELDAASAAGWKVAWFVRPGNPPEECDYPVCKTMSDFEKLIDA